MQNIQKNQKENFNSSFFKKQFFGMSSIQFLQFKFIKKITKKNITFKNQIFVESTKIENQQISYSDQNFKRKKNRIQKKLLNGYSKIHELKLVTIGLASPEKIQSWAEKELPNGKTFGEVTNANTFHYRTFKPSKGGLFCERIFGPIKDFECACGKRKKPTAIESKKILEHEQTSRSFCPNCDVEYTWSILRRYQLGYIKLNAPVTHLWYFKTNPSYLSILFDMKRKDLESIIYCTETITLENTWKYAEQNSSLTRSPTDLYLRWQKFFNMEEKMKQYQMSFENKKVKQKQKKQKFRNSCLTTNFIQKQTNWKVFDKNNFLKSLTNSNSNSNTKHEQTKINILLNISKQKQKKFISFAIQEIWKKFLQKSYQNALIFNTSQEFFFEKFFQKTIQIFSMFFFFSSSLIPENLTLIGQSEGSNNATAQPAQPYSNRGWRKIAKKYKRLFSNNKESVFYDVTILKNFNLLFVDPSFNPIFENLNSKRLDISKNLNVFNKQKISKKKFWKSFFFLLEFGLFFIQQKNRNIKNLKKFSKKDFLFLLNLLPFLKKIKNFKNSKFVKKKFKKIQSFLLQNSVKKTIFQMNSNFDNKFLLIENIQLELHSQILKRKSFLFNSNLSFFYNFVNSSFYNKSKKPYEMNFFSTEKKLDGFIVGFHPTAPAVNYFQKNFMSDQSGQAEQKNTLSLRAERIKKKIDFLQAKHIENINKNNINSIDILNISIHFEKILCFLKSYYEIDFCSIFYNSIFFSCFLENTTINKKLSDIDKNLLFQKSLNVKKWDNIFEKGVEIFVKKSQIYSLIEKVSFEYFAFILYLFKSNLILQIHSNIQLYYSESSKIRNSLFFLLNYVSFLFFSFSKSKKTNKISSKDTKYEYAQENREKSIQSNSITQESSLAGTTSYAYDTNLHSPSLVSLVEGRLQENKHYNQITNQKQRQIEKIKMHIYNKPLNSKAKFNQQKKQIEFNKFKKFFHLDSLVPSSQKTFISQKKVKNKIQKISKNKQQPIEKPQKKANFDIFGGPFEETLQSSSNTKNLRIQENKKLYNQTTKHQQRTFYSKHKATRSKASSAKNNTFLKNKVLTIAYNHIWNNDADWKYFVYYNSLFMYEFEDIPIFIYRSGYPFLDKKLGSTKAKNILFAEAHSIYTKSSESFLPFFHLSIDSSSQNFFVGAGILEKLLTEYTSLELRKMTKQHQILLPKIQQTLRFLKQTAKTKKDSLKIQKYFQKREHIIRRLKFLRKFSRRNSNPSFMILRNLPVLPPDLRPILKLQNQIAASDLNRFYQRIIYRNDRFKKFAKDSATNQSFEIKYAQRLLQEAVDNLIQNGKGSVKAETNSRGQPLKSLSEILKGKQGRFRQYLLGKRVDYSGRSVIVVGPQLKLYECGIPKEMALELFLPFLIQYILKYKLAQTVIGAKNLLKSDSTFTIHLLQKVMKNVPVLLNRAPTLHRLGFQAFLPKLIDGRAILLHPMVCPGFNADFDGDQMAVHIPLTVEARTEAWKFMLSINNFINSATGEPILLPSQDMVLGCFYLTNDFLSKYVGIQFSNLLKKQKYFVINQKQSLNLTKMNFYNFIIQNKSFLYFKNFISVINAYQRKEIFIHTPIWMKVNSIVDFGNESSKPVEIRLQSNGSWEKIQPKYTIIFDRQNQLLDKYIRTTVGRILMNLMIQECIHEKS